MYSFILKTNIGIPADTATSIKGWKHSRFTGIPIFATLFFILSKYFCRCKDMRYFSSVQIFCGFFLDFSYYPHFKLAVTLLEFARIAERSLRYWLWMTDCRTHADVGIASRISMLSTKRYSVPLYERMGAINTAPLR